MNDSTNQAKQDYILNIEEIIKENGFTIEDKDLTRPWGAFFRLKDTDAERFLDLYFPDIKDQFITYIGLSPKYLLIEPNKKLSWPKSSFRSKNFWPTRPRLPVSTTRSASKSWRCQSSYKPTRRSTKTTASG